MLGALCPSDPWVTVVPPYEPFVSPATSVVGPKIIGWVLGVPRCQPGSQPWVVACRVPTAARPGVVAAASRGGTSEGAGGSVETMVQ